MVDKLLHIQKRLAEEGDKTITFFSSLSESDWDQPVYTTGSGWRVRHILAHFISAEQAYQQAIQDVIRGGRGTPDDLDIDQFNELETSSLSPKPVPELIDALHHCREQTIRITRELDDSDLIRLANHPWFGEKEVGWFLKLLYRHQAIHLADVRKALTTCAPVPHVDRFRDIG